MSKPPPPEQPADPYEAHDDVHVARLALQGHLSAARELARRGPGCGTVTEFLERFLTADERRHLSAAQFEVLDGAYEEHWAAANRETVELVNVSKTNFMPNWGKS